MSEQEQYDHYSMTIEWEPLDRIYIVTVPELPGCRTHGETLEEAVKQGQDAIETWIDGSRHWGHPIPPPRYFDLDGPDSWGRDTNLGADTVPEAEPVGARAGRQ